VVFIGSTSIDCPYTHFVHVEDDHGAPTTVETYYVSDLKYRFSPKFSRNFPQILLAHNRTKGERETKKKTPQII